MKLLITSDIHRDVEKLEEILKKVGIISYHLDAGDSNLGAQALKERGILSVKGNTDFFCKLPPQRILKIKNKKFLIIHGHTLKVKFHLNKLVSYAKALAVDICIFGHTHKQFLKEIEGITFLNPGAVMDGRYAIYDQDEIKLY